MLVSLMLSPPEAFHTGLLYATTLQVEKMGASVTASSLWVLHTYCKCQCKSCDHTQAPIKHTYKRLMESLSGVSVVACVRDHPL